MPTDINWTWLLLGTASLFVLALAGGWIRGAMRDRRMEKNQGGADESWGDEVHVMVVEASIDRDLENTGEIDMTELHDRLDLDAVEDSTKKQAYRIIDEAVTILLDDEAWSAYLLKRKDKEVQNV